MLLAGPARAGVYCPGEPPLEPTITDTVAPLSFSSFRSQLLDLVGITVTARESDERKQFLQKRETLSRKVTSGSATLDDKIALSYYLIYLGERTEAIELLTALRGEKHFMIHANLGTAYFLEGDNQSACNNLELLPQAWPPNWPGWTKTQLDWFAKAERKQLDLARIRLREQRKRAGQAGPPTSVDALFDVRFEAEPGKYEAGRIADAELAKLPSDAIPILQQLLFWMPHDTRLYWLLGEVYNATGNPQAAWEILEECSWSRRYNSPELHDHRQVLHAWTEAEAERRKQDDAKRAWAWLPERTQLMIVGGIAGVLAVGFLILQVRLIQKRRRRAAGATRS